VGTRVLMTRLPMLLATLAVVAAAAMAVATWAVTSKPPPNANSGTPTASANPPSSPPSAAPPPAPPPPPAGTDHVEGLVQSVSGGVIQLRTRSGSATVHYAPATLVTAAGPAQLTDVTPGSCVSVPAAPQGGPGAVTAQSVKISPAVGGRCLPPPEAGSTDTPPAGPAPATPAGVFGQVGSISGNTFVVNTPGPGGQTTPATVSVTDATTYSKDAVTDDQAITDGKCMAAQGTQSDGGLQATAISLQPCPPMGGAPHHHLPALPHIPLHLPFHRH